MLSAKGNQQELMNNIAEYVHDTKLRTTMDSITRTERGHGRKKHEVRIRVLMWSGCRRRVWPDFKCIGAVHTRFEMSKGVTEEWHYYISSKALSVQELLHHARTEWSIESMRWLLDVHFDKDSARTYSKILTCCRGQGKNSRISICCINLRLI